MDDSTNGEVIPDPRRPTWVLTHEQAERMIQELFSGNRAVFGKILREMWTEEQGTRAAR